MVRPPSFSTEPPFAGSYEPAAFHLGPAQEEALARLEWLVTQRQRCGLVLGGPGLGKSHLLAAAARRCAGLGAEVAVLSLGGLPPGEWLDLLLERLPLDAASRAEPLRPLEKLENRLRENTLMDRPTVLVCDDVDQGPEDARAGLLRLASAPEPRFARTTVVVTATPAGLGQVPEGFRARAAVRIELGPWTEDDVAAFVAAVRESSSGAVPAFTPEAAATLARFAAGVPRTICQLARLAVVAVADGAGDAVTAETIERVWRELSPAVSPPPHRAARAADDADDATPLPAPRVRVVRRLDG